MFPMFHALMLTPAHTWACWVSRDVPPAFPTVWSVSFLTSFHSEWRMPVICSSFRCQLWLVDLQTVWGQCITLLWLLFWFYFFPFSGVLYACVRVPVCARVCVCTGCDFVSRPEVDAKCISSGCELESLTLSGAWWLAARPAAQWISGTLLPPTPQWWHYWPRLDFYMASRYLSLHGTARALPVEPSSHPWFYFCDYWVALFSPFRFKQRDRV